MCIWSNSQHKGSAFGNQLREQHYWKQPQITNHKINAMNFFFSGTNICSKKLWTFYEANSMSHSVDNGLGLIWLVYWVYSLTNLLYPPGRFNIPSFVKNMDNWLFWSSSPVDKQAKTKTKWGTSFFILYKFLHLSFRKLRSFRSKVDLPDGVSLGLKSICLKT